MIDFALGLYIGGAIVFGLNMLAIHLSFRKKERVEPSQELVLIMFLLWELIIWPWSMASVIAGRSK